ncbi:RNA-binding protein 41 [Selaginella moellendorffii]|uniref:RNA-binding protein 41 n=1 Tax=Selaginella moellendorffii TaxID=88036 RepID=UPI000D1CDBA7|nr:RNA-binding protein 41 [Selaginella moellendorffii]|eukprot:XP_002981470.2 RNA-binding protein 41 [Selaginella moellendorffii]
MEEEGEGIGAPVTRAEFMLQHLLDRQLSTSARLEQVEFKGATQSFYRGIHGAGGVSTLAEFRSQQDEGEIQKPEEKCKRQRYGPDPVFLQSQEMERKKQTLSRESSIAVKQEMGRHEKELEVSLIEGKQRLQAIAHLTVEGVSLRKPLPELSVVCCGTTPEERARMQSGKEISRSSSEVFSSSAPPLLDLDTYLDEATQDAKSTGNEEKNPPMVSEENIASNRLSFKELQEWSDGKFRDHQQGVPSNVLYVKNLCSEVTEEDLAALFLRFKKQPDDQILFRLMQKGRMKGQAFVTFPDVVAATRALQLVHGYMLKGRPMIVEYARGKK